MTSAATEGSARRTARSSVTRSSAGGSRTTCRAQSTSTPASSRAGRLSFDLAIEGGEVVTPRGRARLHVYIDDGRVATVSAERHDARERVDADGLFVMPGMVDAHVHFMDPG